MNFAISIRQPWASMITGRYSASGHLWPPIKTVENRFRVAKKMMDYTGWVYIHAGKKRASRALLAETALALQNMLPPTQLSMALPYYDAWGRDRLPHGAIIGRAHVSQITRLDFAHPEVSPYAMPESVHICFDRADAFCAPVECKGQLGNPFFKVLEIGCGDGE